jgi:hypothetical protein
MDFLEWIKKKNLLTISILVVAVCLIVGLAIGIPLSQKKDNLKRANALLTNFPIIDGLIKIKNLLHNFDQNSILKYIFIYSRHNDLPSMIRKNFENQFKKFNFTDITKIKEQLNGTSGVTHTDLTRIKQGKLGGQFWAAYASCESLAKDAIRIHLEQLDVIKRILQMYPDHFQFVTKSNRN